MSNREFIGYHLFFRCENCGHDRFQIMHFEQKHGNHHEDIIIERNYYLKCTRCGSEEADRVMTIVSSWSAPNINRDDIPKWLTNIE